MRGRALRISRRAAMGSLALAFAFGLLAGLVPAVWGPEGLNSRIAVKTKRAQADVLHTFAPAIKRVLPAVVSITATRVARAPVGGPAAVSWQRSVTDTRTPETGELINRPGACEIVHGSGVLVGPEGPLLTSSRLVQGATEITICLADNERFLAHLVGTDAVTDIAVLRVDARDLPYLRFGDSSKIAFGDFTVAIGSPLEGGNTVALGIISATGIPDEDGEDHPRFIQTLNDVPAGIQGGALINQRGELVGINTLPCQALEPDPTRPLAVPANVARQVMEQIVMHGHVTRRGRPAHERTT
ncbi:MAG: trypsin-like peptidase domain-containing protein [Acidobacteriia bacterium]|nr:trypsin-like peptidase domain-containing protein [Terriglobia bacterium]